MTMLRLKKALKNVSSQIRAAFMPALVKTRDMMRALGPLSTH